MRYILLFEKLQYDTIKHKSSRVVKIDSFTT
jgi:hypothetical protein